MKFSRYIIGFLLSGSMLMLASCSDDIEINAGKEPGVPEDDGMVDISLNFILDDFNNRATRGDGDEGESSSGETVGNYLKDIDLFVYALRDEHDKVLYQYGKGVADEFKKDEKNEKGEDVRVIDKVSYPALANYVEDEDNNQTLMKVKWTPLKDENKQPINGHYTLEEPITLRVMRNTVYKLSCWAQNSQTTAYDFNYLTAVKVNYNNAENNDTKRDAYCVTSTFSIGQVDSDVKVTLTRPFAQINVGVKIPGEEENTVDRYNEFSQSKIQLEGVATYFNVVENRVWNDKDYKDWEKGTFGKNYNPEIFNETDRKPEFQTVVTFNYKEFDRTPLEIHDYSDWTGTEPSTKFYNPLSMCYVLVPESTKDLNDDDSIKDNGSTNNQEDNTEGGIVAPSLTDATIQLVSFSIRSENGANEKTYTVPKEISVKRNWRTNLLFENWNWIENEQQTK